MKKIVQSLMMVHVSDEAFRFGLIQFGNKAYTEVELRMTSGS